MSQTARLILVEGIPGSGKSTTAKSLELLLTARGVKVVCFEEGDLHPCDLAWHACVPLDVYHKLAVRFEDKRAVLKEYTLLEDYAYVAYTKLGLGPEHGLFSELKQYDPYQGRVPLAKFRALHSARWQHFADRAKPDTSYIFECAYLQNHLTELMLTYQQDAAFITAYMLELIQTVLALAPQLVYLCPTNVSWTVDNIAKERRSDNPAWQDWIAASARYVATSNYGVSRGLSGRDGVIQFCNERQRLELDIIKQLSIPVRIRDIKTRVRGFVCSKR